MLSKIDFLDSIYRGTSLKHPEMPQVLDMRIPVPPIKDQELIVSKIEELQPFVDRYEVAWRKLEALNQKMPADMQKSIVQLAIQGKLVEQRNEEGTGDTLYESIKAEKDQLIKSGLLKREKPPVSISNEEIFYDIPESWRWKRLQSVAKIIVDCPHSTPKYYDEETGYYALGTKCMNSDGEITSLFNVDQATYKKRIERLEPSENDLVYSREGSIVCRAVILPPNKKICLGQRVMLIRCTEHIIPKYMQYYLMSEHTLRFLTRNYKGVGAKHINVADVCALPVPLPPLAEQKRIVAKLEEILPLCERLK
jgi:type I restriction enzyme S subunit